MEEEISQLRARNESLEREILHLKEFLSGRGDPYSKLVSDLTSRNYELRVARNQLKHVIEDRDRALQHTQRQTENNAVGYFTERLTGLYNQLVGDHTDQVRVMTIRDLFDRFGLLKYIKI